MALTISSEVADTLANSVKAALAKMSDDHQALFEDEYKQKSKSLGLMMFFAIVLPIQHFLLGKTGMGIAFVITFCGMGAWYIVEWFLTPGRVKDYNANLATQILTDIKLVHG